MQTGEMTHHYFASSAFGWATAETRDKAIAKLARMDAVEIRRLLPTGGLLVYTVCVNLPPDTPYDIENYAPSTMNDGTPVPKEDVVYFRVVTPKGVAIQTSPAAYVLNKGN